MDFVGGWIEPTSVALGVEGRLVRVSWVVEAPLDTNVDRMGELGRDETELLDDDPADRCWCDIGERRCWSGLCSADWISRDAVVNVAEDPLGSTIEFMEEVDDFEPKVINPEAFL